MTHTDRPDEPCGSGYVALRDYFTLWLERLEQFYNQRMTNLDEKTSLALAAADKAVTKSEAETEKRFEGVNEFRATLADQAARLIPRDEAQIRFATLEKDLVAISKEIQERRNLISDRSQDERLQRQSWFIPMMVIGAIATLALLTNVLNLLYHVQKP